MRRRITTSAEYHRARNAPAARGVDRLANDRLVARQQPEIQEPPQRRDELFVGQAEGVHGQRVVRRHAREPVPVLRPRQISS